MPGPCGVCNESSTHICGGCKIINYCSKEHQRIHWAKGHKAVCKPIFRVEKNELLGRHLVAARNIRMGEIILQEVPLVIGPKAVSRPICLGCHTICTPNSYFECDGCGFPMCSVNCQVSEHHFEECRVMSRQKYRVKVEMERKSLSYFPIVVLRCLLLKDKNPEKYNKILNLQSHFYERIGGPLFAMYERNVVQFLLERLGMKQFDRTAILTVAGILDTNAFEVGTERGKLRGLYNTASMMAHNCRSNTKHTFHDDFAMTVTAISDIAAGDVIFATYTQTFWGTLARRSHLRSVKCFDCTCERCSDPTELGTYIGAMLCMQCSTVGNFGPYVISTDPMNDDALWKCEKCPFSVLAKDIRSRNESLKREISTIDKTEAENLERFLRKYGVDEGGPLHSRHSCAVQVKHALVQIYGNSPKYRYPELSNQVLQNKIRYCRELLDLVDVLEPGCSAIRGQLQTELQAANEYQANG